MARSVQGKGNLWAIVATAVSIVAIAALGIFVFQDKFDRYSNLAEFPVESYLEGRSIWSSDFYRVVGTVEEVLNVNDEGIHLASVRLDFSDRRLPVFVSSENSSSAIARSQAVKMKVMVDGKGRIRCVGYSKK